MRVYFGTLAFTKPLEKLVFRTVPLQVLQDWLSKPKGPHLVEASGAAAPEKALAIAVTRRMLYGEEAPLVGVGLMYKPHYISPELGVPLQCRLHASARMAHGRLPSGVRGQANLIPTPFC